MSSSADLLVNQRWESRSDYEARGGYAEGAEGADLIHAIEIAGLLGRGGGAFPTHRKITAVMGTPGDRFLVCNGEEGEPASVKDRWLMRNRPHVVIDGVLRVSRAIDATISYIYLSDEAARESLLRALGEFGDELRVQVDIVFVSRGYVAGEETSVVRAINGGPAKPMSKPPRPYEAGVSGAPTLILNVETLANVAGIAVSHPAKRPDLFLSTITRSDGETHLVEAVAGTVCSELLEMVGENLDEVRGLLMGGFSYGVLGRRGLNFRLSHSDLRAEGSGLGCGAIVVLGKSDCPIAATADVIGFFARENAQQCGACINGTNAMRDVLISMMRGSALPADIAKLAAWSTNLRGRGACGLLDGATQVVACLLREFEAEVRTHLSEECVRCAALTVEDAKRSRFAVDF